jgi:hypothetical protein
MKSILPLNQFASKHLLTDIGLNLYWIWKLMDKRKILSLQKYPGKIEFGSKQDDTYLSDLYQNFDAIPE